MLVQWRHLLCPCAEGCELLFDEVARVLVGEVQGFVEPCRGVAHEYLRGDKDVRRLRLQVLAKLELGAHRAVGTDRCSLQRDRLPA